MAVAAPKPWTRSVMAMLLAMSPVCIAVFWVLALRTAALIGITMRCIALRPAKSIFSDNNACP